MRFIARLLVCAGVISAAAGCDPVTDRKYMREGVGVDLNSERLPEATDRQDEYVYYICEQAGYRADETNRISSCFAKGGWTAFVQAGMNDIDQRCDAYLSWLDAKRRDREPVLRQLAAAGAAAHSIMTVSGAGTDSLEIVSAAFGLAAASYANWNSRLLLEVNQSTVQTLVYSRQTDFRNAIAKEQVPDRPRAIYLLRNYVRICLPITIETDINTSITLVQRGDGAAVKKTPVVQTADLKLDVSKPTKPSEKRAIILNPALGTVEESIPFADGVKIQRALCAKADGDFGPSTSDTRKRLRDYLAGYRIAPPETQQGVLKSGDDRTDVMTAVVLYPNCKDAGFKNTYEVGAFTKFPIEKMRKMLAGSLKKIEGEDKAEAATLAKRLEETKTISSKDVTNTDIRKAIGILSKRFRGNSVDTIDHVFLKKLFDDNAL